MTSTFALIAIAALAGCSTQRPTFELYPQDALATTATLAVVTAAVRDAHDSVGHHYVTNANGSVSDPSFKQSSGSWSTGKSPQNASVALTRSSTEFLDKGGHPVRFDVISARNRPTLVFVSYDGPGGSLSILNAMAISLQKQGVRPAQ